VTELNVLGDLWGWCESVWDQIRSVSIWYLIVGCALQTCQTLLNAVAWRNILRASFPDEDVPRRPIAAAYAGGIGLNAFLPAQAGTIAYLGMFRAIIPNSKMVTIVAGGVAQNLFYAVMGGAVYLFLFLSRPSSTSETSNEATDNGTIKIVLIVLAVLLVAVVLRLLWKRLHGFWQQALDGAAVLRSPRRYIAGVLAPQMLSYIIRMCVNATFMKAFGIPVSVRNVFLIIAANSISSTLAVTPGGVGTQQALASVALKNVAPASTVTAYSLAQQAILMAWNITFGLTAMATTFGVSATRDLIRSSRATAKSGGIKQLEQEDAADPAAPAPPAADT
jgi:uncharacterized membrane protein YbhN (UPF0104 family)